jgi:HD-like signal output (HDOD) protein
MTRVLFVDVSSAFFGLARRATSIHEAIGYV